MDISRVQINKNCYYLYIVTNKYRTVLNVHTTGDWIGKLKELEYSLTNTISSHEDCSILLYWEMFEDALDAVRREQEIKSWSKRRKNNLIDTHNPDWQPLNQKY